MSATASQITNVSIVSQLFVPVQIEETWKMFPFGDVIMRHVAIIIIPAYDLKVLSVNLQTA